MVLLSGFMSTGCWGLATAECNVQTNDTSQQLQKGTATMSTNPIGRALRNRHAGQHTLVWARADLQAPENFILTSPAFEHGAPIPERYRGRLFGANISPALAWTTPPADTAELLLIVQDPDVPRKKPVTHALTAGIDPSLSGIAENGLTYPSAIPGVKHGKGPLGRCGWAGPLPPRSHGPHSYVFQLFALDYHPDLPDRFSLEDVLQVITGHVIGRARLDGTYENR
ncbi:MAG: YbhB/YbcL family Raf kinase inhibitor-like protein [Solirubrobacteraceae bacterium]